MDGLKGHPAVRLRVGANCSRLDYLPQNPLPAVQVERGKLLVKRSQFDIWLQAHPYSSADAVDVSRIVDAVINGFKKVN
jgi:hypothetical protein